MENALGFVWKYSIGNPLHLVLALVLGTTITFALNVFYNIFLHPLRNYPGPLASRATGLWRAHKLLSGHLPQIVKQLHDEYGPVIRIAPNELSFIDSEAWKDIYGHHGSYEMAKDPRFYRFVGNRIPHNVSTAGRELHSVMRRQLSHGFSERSMRAQEPCIGEYVDLLIHRLEEKCSDGKTALEMRAWLNFTTFDIIGNLGFGSDFGCLENSKYHPWVLTIVENLRSHAIMRALRQYLPAYVLYLLQEHRVLKGRKENIEYAYQTIRKRMEVEVERPDLIEGLVRKKNELAPGEIELNAMFLINAGSETTATLLSGAFFLLGSHRDVLEKLTREVRTTFSSEKDITLISVGSLSYMLACLDECLRMYPPVPLGLPRVVPKGGFKIAGNYVPEDTSVAVWQWAINYSKVHWHKPDEFHPERFLGDKQFANDNLIAMQPFSAGPRNCIGRNLAYAEMRLILARILYRFDIELAPEARDWVKRQKIYTLWDKPELPVYLKPVNAGG
ncbi:cytochrome P450 [Hypoxylon trugodes]|uniref:cytochrome P450 n=1 Tax=Hypoxylon trugodes TaxID=326681 RepID=UPI00219E288E|nr:cytochrome P450 [Hypoxylon trugodes]KAI1387748.1 cytochrome P450 [Hypoxylon trugodes]